MPRKTKSPALDGLLESFGQLDDPRVNRRRFHPLVNVLTMALFGTISGADGWEALELFAKERKDFFASFLKMARGTPSADTFRRVFEALDPKQFQDAFRRWLKPLIENLEGQTIALDGKTLRGAMAHSKTGSGAFHLMHVWATEQRLLLAQEAVEGAPGEISAAIELLELLDIKGATVTADANSCTAAMSGAVRKAGADYVLALKGNRSTLHDYVQREFARLAEDGYPDVPFFESDERAHGRREVRIVRAIPLNSDDLPPTVAASWTDLNTAVLVQRVRADKRVTLESAYYVTSRKPEPKRLATQIRDHWKIENELHHCLDVSFDEDRRKIRHENGAQNFALVARYALSLIKREPSKMSVAMKRRKAAWSRTYLLDVLTAGFTGV